MSPEGTRRSFHHEATAWDNPRRRDFGAKSAALKKMKHGDHFHVKSHHPEESLVGEVLVLLDGGEDAEDEADQDHHEPETERGQLVHIIIDGKLY